MPMPEQWTVQATMTRDWDLAALSTWLPNDSANTIPESDALAHYPVLLQHGAQDPMISFDRAQHG